jgi:hypothetical protein
MYTSRPILLGMMNVAQETPAYLARRPDTVNPLAQLSILGNNFNTFSYHYYLLLIWIYLDTI